jgi:hypothetical protein
VLCDLSYLARVARLHAPSELVPGSAWARFASLPALLPQALTVAGLECRLEGGEAPVDLAVCISAKDGGRETLARHLRDPEVAAAWRNAGWSLALDFFERWSNPGSALFDRVPFVWMEFDLDEVSSKRPVPIVFIGLATDGSAEARCGDCDGVIETGLQALRGRSLPPRTRRTLRRCHDGLPTGGRFLHLADMSPRNLDAVRIVAAIPRGVLPSYLERIGWTGSTGDLTATLTMLGEFASSLGIGMDISEGVGPCLGLEYYYPTSPLDDPRWAALLDRLVAWGACTAEKRSAIAGWPGRAGDPPDPRSWPVQLLRPLLIKVVYETGVRVRAKAYLALVPHLAFF